MHELSIIIPAYNEANIIPNTIKQIHEYFNNINLDVEIILVDNCSNDNTQNVISKLSKNIPNLVYLKENMLGKGYAVNRGILSSKGKYCFICDADLSMPINEFAKFYPMKDDVDIVIGSREMKESVRTNESITTHYRGRIFNFIVRLLQLTKYKDTQCGFKLFRKEAGNCLFNLQLTFGFCFDVEILFIAFLKSYRVSEVPILWNHCTNTKVKFFKDSSIMFFDLLRIYYYYFRGFYK